MLIGRFGDTTGRPYLEGRLIIPRLEVTGEISFLVDTGADQSLLSPLDGQRLRLDYSRLGNEGESIGMGGIVQNFQEQAFLTFSDAGRTLYAYAVNIAIATPSPDIMDLPSLLGRDVVDHWRMVYEPDRDLLTFTVRTADVVIPLG